MLKRFIEEGGYPEYQVTGIFRMQLIAFICVVFYFWFRIDELKQSTFRDLELVNKEDGTFCIKIDLRHRKTIQIR